MGLIKTAWNAISSVFANQNKDYFYCAPLSEDILAVKGQKQISKRSGNIKDKTNSITTGSIIAVADGQCMMLVEQDRILDVCAEPGEYIFDISAKPSFFPGDNLAENTSVSLKNIWEHFKFTGHPGKDTRIYYFNTQTISGNKYSTSSPVPFRVVNRNLGLDIDIAIQCFGEYSYRIINPILFYTNVCGNIEAKYTRHTIEGLLRSELTEALQPALAKISEMGIRYSSLSENSIELSRALNEALSAQWCELRGLEIVSCCVSSVKTSEKDEQMIKKLQKSLIMRGPTIAAATLVGTKNSAMRAAVKNKSLVMIDFTGLGTTHSLFTTGQQQWATTTESWICVCGHSGNTGKFCAECGRPLFQMAGWTCSCGAVNKGRFCPECGQPKPDGIPQYKCDKCGWELAFKNHPPKFCPECSDPFDI